MNSQPPNAKRQKNNHTDVSPGTPERPSTHKGQQDPGSVVIVPPKSPERIVYCDQKGFSENPKAGPCVTAAKEQHSCAVQNPNPNLKLKRKASDYFERC